MLQTWRNLRTEILYVNRAALTLLHLGKVSQHARLKKTRKQISFSRFHKLAWSFVKFLSKAFGEVRHVLKSDAVGDFFNRTDLLIH